MIYPGEEYEHEMKRLFRFKDCYSKPRLKIIPSTEDRMLELTEEDNNSKVLICLFLSSY